ncbi:hypothetical protein LTR08_003017 [Meristemomyces frigidus]|nr:hypothetical protein LTR08_003017 [Meristemomyces frigidus]
MASAAKSAFEGDKVTSTIDSVVRQLSTNTAPNGNHGAVEEMGLAATVSAPVQESEKDSFSNEVQYHTMGWFQAGAMMIAETVSLGILSLPSCLAKVGYVAGLLLIVGLGLLTTYTGYVVYQLKMAHPEVMSFADALGVMFGKAGLWFGKVVQTLLLLFIMGAHIVIFGVMMNTLTEHGLCTVIFMALGALVSFFVSMPRTFKDTSWVSMGSCVSIATATIIAMVAIGIKGPGVGNSFAVTPAALTSFSDGAMAASNIILAYNGQIGFPAIISEMKEPRDFPKALAMLQIVTITFYVVVAIVIYNFAGQDVASPALGSAPPLIRKIAFGIATPTIVVAGVISALVAAKQIYKDVWSKQPHVIKERSPRAYVSWYAILIALYIAAWLIAEVIPVFTQLLGVMGALLGTWFALGFCSMFWLWMNWQGSLAKSYGLGWKKASLACLNLTIVAISTVLCVVGMYGSIKSIATNGSSSKPFSCADNSA